MSNVMQPGWWLASDGKWYPPQLRDTVKDRLVSPSGADESGGPGWWLASDGKWYPPALHPDAKDRASQARSQPSEPKSEPQDAYGQARESSEESAYRRYVGFVPDPGPEPEIRPELREPLREPAFVGAIPVYEESEEIWSSEGSWPAHLDDDGVSSRQSGAFRADDPGTPRTSGRPRHRKHSRRWIR